MQVHTTTDADTGTYNNDTYPCNIDDELYARVFYGYLEAAVMQENHYYAFQKMDFIKYSNWCDTVNNVYAFFDMYFFKYYNTTIQIYVSLVISAVKYHNKNFETDTVFSCMELLRTTNYVQVR